MDTFTQKLKAGLQGPCNTFEQKLRAGLQGEEIARVYLESLGHKVEALTGFNRSGDLVVNGIPVEVKTDIRAAATGKICIEHRSLVTHTAKWYLWVVPHIYRVSSESLDFIRDTWPDKLPGGDDGRITTLLPYLGSTFNEHFHKPQRSQRTTTQEERASTQ